MRYSPFSPTINNTEANSRVYMTQQLPKHQAVRRVLWQILILNWLVAASKITVGVFTGTISIVADGIHSTVDGASNVVGLIAQRIASQPPDEDHPYGHERFETLATLAIGGLLLLTAWEVLKVAVERLFSGDAPDIGPLQFAVLIATLVINLFVATYERRAAHRLNSDLLAADADHTASDVWVTISVIISLIAVELGLAWMDAAAGLAIVGLIVFVAWGIVRRTSPVLVDAAPIPPHDIAQVVDGTPGVEKVLRARSRGTQDAVHVDLDVQVAPVISAELAHSIADTVRERIQASFPHISEVHIQIAPDATNPSDYLTAARAAADLLGLSVHEIIGVTTPNGKILEMHVEVPAGMTLSAAHDQIETLEARLLEQPDIIEVVTHIEPAAMGSALPADTPEAARLHDEALAQLNEHFPQNNWHHSCIRRDRYGYAFTTHCHLPGDISIETAHQIAEEAELHLRSNFPQLHRVTIHTEPAEERHTPAP